MQWALAYAAAAFALLQGLDIVGQRFGWLDAAERALIVALAIGFFVTVVLAWYHGERGAERVSGVELLSVSKPVTVSSHRVSRDSSADRRSFPLERIVRV